MIRFSTLVGVVATLLSGALFVPRMQGQQLGQDEHKKLNWSGAGGCVVDFVRTPCRTVRYHQYSFGSPFGFDRITSSETIEATDHDGSESKTTSGTRRPPWLFPAERFKTTELLLRSQGQVVDIDHEQRVYEVHQRRGSKGPYWEEDNSECSHTASHYLYLSDRLPSSRIASFYVVGYRGRDDRGAGYEVYFAPSIGCQQMSFKMSMRGFLGWVTAEYEMVVDSYVLGTPDARLFTVPVGYKQVPSILGSQSEPAKGMK